MTACQHFVDWASKPEPWRTIGPGMLERFRREIDGFAPRDLAPWWRRLHAHRVASGLSVPDVLDRCVGVAGASTNIYSAEKGEIRLSKPLVERLAALYGVPVETFAGAWCD